MKKQLQARSAPKKHRAIQTSRHFGVSPHRHTGHVLPRRSTSYPILTMIVLCVGVLLFSWTRLVTADTGNIIVHTSVPGPAPTQAASIDSPANGTQYTSTPITVSGSCPLNTYVNLLRNGFSSGVAICDASGRYQITTDLFQGTNQLVARDFNFTDVPGPDSAIVTVYYQPPGTSISKGAVPYNPTNPNTSNVPKPLILSANFTLLGYYVGQPASWKVYLEGGTAPYAISADWGDGSHKLFSRPTAGMLNLDHVYKQPGNYRNSYVVKISVSDADGNQSVLQLVAIVSPKSKTIPASGGISSGDGSSIFGSGNIGRLVGYSWAGYGIVLLMLFSFWLGERRELGILRPQAKKRRHA